MHCPDRREMRIARVMFLIGLSVPAWLIILTAERFANNADVLCCPYRMLTIGSTFYALPGKMEILY